MKALAWGAVVDSENNYWIPIYKTDALIKGRKDGSYEYIGSLDFRKYDIEDKCILKVFEVKDYVLLFARASYDVWIVDKLTNILIHKKYYDGPKRGIADIVQCGENAVVLPYSADNPIIIWNMNFHNVEILKYNNKPHINQFAFVRGISTDKFVYSATRSLNEVHVCKIDVNDKKTLFFKTSLRMVNAISIKDDNVWVFGLSGENKTVFQEYNNDMSALIEQYILSDIDPVLENGNMKYFRMCVYKEKIVLIPYSPERIYIYDLKICEGHYLVYPNDTDNEVVNKGASFVEIQCGDNGIYLFPFGYDGIMKLNLEDEKFYNIKILFTPEMERLLNANAILSSDILSEGYPMSLNEYITAIQ